MEFGEKLQALRREQGLSQEGLAEQLGVSRQAVSKWESGAARPETEKILTLCRMYGLSADELLLDGELPPQKPAPSAGGRMGTKLTAALAVLLALALTAGVSSWSALQRQTAENARLTQSHAQLSEQVGKGEQEAQALRQQVSQLEQQLSQLEQQLAEFGQLSPIQVEAAGDIGKALGRYFLELGWDWRLDYIPDFAWGQAPKESADYLMWAYVVNAGNWSDESVGTMSRDYIDNAVLAHFAVADLSHTSLWKTWNFDGETYTAVPQGYNDPSFYVFQSLTVSEHNGGRVYTAQLLRCWPRQDQWGDTPITDIYERLLEEPPLTGAEQLLEPMSRETLSFTLGFSGPVFLEHTVEDLGR